MLIQKTTLSLAVLLMAAGSATGAAAQDTAGTAVSEKTATRTAPTRRIKRDVQPISYWVEAQALRVRDNPVAGNILATLDHGKQVSAYSQYENWVQISKPDAPQQWVNSDFLSNSRVSWASFDKKIPARASDVKAIRIKNPEDRKSRVYAVRLKQAETGNALITTREASSEGVFYQNRFVSCDDKKALGLRLVGEGSSFLAAQNDFRNYALDIYGPEQIDDKERSSLDRAISKFACNAKAF